MSSGNREEYMHCEALWSDDGWCMPLDHLLKPKNAQHQVNHSINYRSGVNTVSVYSLALMTKSHWWGMLPIRRLCVSGQQDTDNLQT